MSQYKKETAINTLYSENKGSTVFFLHNLNTNLDSFVIFDINHALDNPFY